MIGSYTPVKKLLLLFFIGAFTQSCREDSGGKMLPAAINKDASFIKSTVTVKAYSADSIMVTTTFTHNGDTAFAFYKPLLPYRNFTQDLFSIYTSPGDNLVAFFCKEKEVNLKFADGELSSEVVPKLAADNFLVLRPGDSLELITNIARKYDFKRHFKKGNRNFQLVYIAHFPYVVNHQQAMEYDSLDHMEKPVYYSVIGNENENPDLVRVSFQIP